MTKETDNQFITDINTINGIIDEMNKVSSDIKNITYTKYTIRRNKKGDLVAYTCNPNITISSNDISSIMELYNTDTLENEKKDRLIRDKQNANDAHYIEVMSKIEKLISEDDWIFLNTYLDSKSVY